MTPAPPHSRSRSRTLRTEAFHDARSWTAATIDDSRSWYYPLSETCRSALDRAVRAAAANGVAITSASVPAETAAACPESLRPVLDALENGRGFAVIDGIPADRY